MTSEVFSVVSTCTFVSQEAYRGLIILHEVSRGCQLWKA